MRSKILIHLASVAAAWFAIPTTGFAMPVEVWGTTISARATYTGREDFDAVPVGSAFYGTFDYNYDPANVDGSVVLNLITNVNLYFADGMEVHNPGFAAYDTLTADTIRYANGNSVFFTSPESLDLVLDMQGHYLTFSNPPGIPAFDPFAPNFDAFLTRSVRVEGTVIDPAIARYVGGFSVLGRIDAVKVSTVPEPSTLGLAAFGFLSLFVARRRKSSINLKTLIRILSRGASR